MIDYDGRVAVTQAATAPPKDAQRALKPFRIGAQVIDDEAYDVSVTLSASSQSLTPQYEIPSTGFLNDVYILVENVVTSSTATATSTSTGVGVLLADGPYSVIDSILFTDTNNSEIIGPIGGWDLYVIGKWGGYCFNDDPEANTDLFTATTNATASSSAAGSFSFMLRIPVELVPRDALGSLPNKSSSTPFKVKTTVAGLASVFANTATVGGACRFRMTPVSYWEPTATDGSGNPIADQPPGVNTTQYWNKTDYTVNLGSFSALLTNSVGFPVRNLGFVLRDSTLSRAQGESDWPDPFKLQLQSNVIIDRIKKVWKKRITEDYNYGAAGDAVGQKDNGLYWEPYCKDFGPKPGWETRRGYLRTTDGMRLQAKGTIGGSGVHTFTVYTNYIGIGAGTSLAALTS
jgi:hypothetical protein